MQQQFEQQQFEPIRTIIHKHFFLAHFAEEEETHM